MTLEETLERLEKVTPFKEMKQRGFHYERRISLMKRLKESKSAHRQIIFGDCPDEII